ncbi:hypothetical protein OHB01_28755 [Microbispora hainanensis]|jgi:hypothetical protein|uniref:Signal peptidase II n=1 Tax=Microbispora hainanensis TaxID=568844 RepID=A0ABZ1SWX6_9ACTN|nr:MULTISPECIES: hypothetical protein [Microbispora]NJP26082.1 hypothetical protein [Microbispora sp. CL1-1]TQS12850.1 hypothetical protein FLW53_18115 [Microbispora sp. SCL1-1]
MREVIRLAGAFLVAAGISGTIDHLAVQPFWGAILNVFNRQVIPRLGFLTGYEIYADLFVAVVGVVVLAAAWRRDEDA